MGGGSAVPIVMSRYSFSKNNKHELVVLVIEFPIFYQILYVGFEPGRIGMVQKWLK